MKKVELIGSNGVPVVINDLERKSIDNSFDVLECPVHYMFRTDIRVKKETRRNDVCVLTPHYVACFYQLKPGEKFVMYCIFHISRLELLCHSMEPLFIVLKTDEYKLTVTGKGCLKFAQLLYRNFMVSYPTLKLDEIFEVRTPEPSLFPFVQLPLSASQVFQFSYAGFVSAKKLDYRHEVVRYIHHMLLSRNSILDLSQLPLDLFAYNSGGSAIDPILSALRLTKFACGICCDNQRRPELLTSIAAPMEKSHPFHIIHFDNCGITDGLNELRKAIFKHDSLPVYYWNLSNNTLNDFDSFTDILTHQTVDLLHLNVSYCGISPKASAYMFEKMSDVEKLWSIRHLHIAGIKMDKRSYLSFRKFIEKLIEVGSLKISSIDISGISDYLPDIINLLTDKSVPIEQLYISDVPLVGSSHTSLLKFIKSSSSLKYLDFSNTSLDSQSVGQIVSYIGHNQTLTDISLIMDRLSLRGNGLAPIIRAFLNCDNDLKWHRISMSGNGMNSEDLLNLLSVLKEFPELVELNLSNNFDSSMKNIGLHLSEILSFPCIKRLSLAGGSKRKLRGEITSFLQSIMHSNKLEYLDVSNNFFGDDGYSTVISFLRSNSNLQKFIVDGNNVRSIEFLLELSNCPLHNHSLVSLPFPSRDARLMILDIKEEKQQSITQRLSDIRMALVQNLNQNRASMHLINELPFEASNEIIEVINEITNAYSKMLEKYKYPKKHSCVSDILHLPLPFQRMGEVPEGGGKIKLIKIGEMEIYETESMKKIVYEDNEFYPLPDFLLENGMNNEIQE